MSVAPWCMMMRIMQGSGKTQWIILDVVTRQYLTGINLQTGGDYVGLLTAPPTLIFSKLRKQKKTLQCKYLLYTFKVGAGRSWQ